MEQSNENVHHKNRMINAGTERTATDMIYELWNQRRMVNDWAKKNSSDHQIFDDLFNQIFSNQCCNNH